jgi:Glycosyl hydrolase family 79 C-terminal beta domain
MACARTAVACALVCSAVGTGAATAEPVGPAHPGQPEVQPAPQIAPLPPITIPIDPTAKSQPLPAGFVGLSLEYRSVLTYAGLNPTAINPVFVHLIQNLAPNQTPVLRIGGDSTDWSWWPVAHMAKPPGVTYTITPQWVRTARALAQDTGAHLILGINLEAGSPRVERTEARALLSGLGWSFVQAVELGNEPELYSVLPWYKTGTGERVRGRPKGYNFLSFSNQFLSFHEAEPWMPLAGPSSGSYGWLQNLSHFLAADPWLRMVTVHSYWLNKCARSPLQAGYPSIPHLLDASPPSRTSGSLGTYAALAHAHNVPIRVDEMNSVTCGGEHGVSDVFASALWALNALFEAAGDNVDGVNIHTFPGTANQLFGFAEHNGTWYGAVRPEYYGLLMFTQAMPPCAKLLRIYEPAKDPLRAWATLAADGTERVVLINDSLTNPRTVVVQPPWPTQLGGLLAPGVAAPSLDEPGQLEQLLAPSASATSGITLGGQSFIPDTTTGELSGSPTTVTVTPSADTYTVTLPAASAAMLTLPPAPAPQ